MPDKENYYNDKINALKSSVSNLTNDVEYTDYREFQVLLAAVFSLMKENDFTSLMLRNANGLAAEQDKVVENLLENFGIKDKDSAIYNIGKSCFRGCQWQYTQFDMYAHGKFDDEFNQFSEKGKSTFLKCKEFSDKLKDFAGDRGYIAWDIALAIDMIRESIFCDYFDETSAVKIMDDIVNPMLAICNSWEDFAVSFIAGGTYSAYKNSNFDEEEARKSFDNLIEIVTRLFEDESVNVWKVYSWFKKKEYFRGINKDDLKTLVNSEQGCFVSDRVSLDGAKPCLIYREEPFKNFPDSGWRFFAGDESKEYSADPKNSNIFPLNVVANFDESIIPLLDSEVNTAFIRKHDDEFINFKTVSDAMKAKK